MNADSRIKILMEMAETMKDVDKLTDEALLKALRALEASEPKISHYPEPISRHREAIEIVRRAINERE